MLTVLIPSFNHEEYILDCLRSASDINLEGMKILVVDDGSTDGTVNVVERFAADNKNLDIKLVKKENAGLVDSLNIGLSIIKTDYIIICASDDYLLSSGVRECLDSISKDKKYKFAIGNAIIFSKKGIGDVIYKKEQENFFFLPPKDRVPELFLNYPSPILLQSTIFRADFIRSIGGWDAEIALDDYALFVKIFKTHPEIGVDFLYLKEVVAVAYRQHENNTYKKTFRLFKMVIQVVDSYACEGLRERANLKYAASYFLSAIKNKKFKDCYKIFEYAASKNFAIFFVFLIRRFFSYAKK